VKAVAITGNHVASVVSMDRPVPRAGEVLLDVSYCGVCGSDLHMLSMPAGMLPPGHVPGHEFTGVIAELDQQAGGWAVGDRVVVFPMIACGQCAACQAGHPNQCANGIDHGPGLGRQGAYAESVAVPAGMLRRLPEAVSDADGALTEPLAVALRAVKISGAAPDDPACVLGVGPIGMLTVAVLQARGTERVAVVEPVPGRRSAVQRLGVTAVPPDEARTSVPPLLDGEPPAVVIDTTGHRDGAPLAIELLRPAGRLTIVGMPDDPAPINLATLAFKELTVRGSLCYDETDFTEALGHIAAGRIPCSQIITTTASLDDAPTVLTDLRTSTTQQVKVLLRPGPVTLEPAAVTAHEAHGGDDESAAVASPAGPGAPVDEPCPLQPLSRVVYLVAAAVFALLMALSGRYGFHRDELYFIVCARHLQASSVDQPILTPLITRISLGPFGASLVGLRLWPALAVAGTVILGGLLAREFGGGRTAQILSALGVATSGVVFGSGHLDDTTIYDILAWGGLALVAAASAGRGTRSSG
jgi:(R,R)-butanediol dehydrogenase / meso-butanediol dehydrogenase / diacetyl reductase